MASYPSLGLFHITPIVCNTQPGSAILANILCKFATSKHSSFQTSKQLYFWTAIARRTSEVGDSLRFQSKAYTGCCEPVKLICHHFNPERPALHDFISFCSPSPYVQLLDEA